MTEASFNYIEQAHVTASGSFHGELIGRADLKQALCEFIEAGERLDAIKKALFYGRKTELFERPESASHSVSTLQFAMLAGNPDDAINMFHGIIGKATESAELIEALLDSLFEPKPLDHTNVAEEVGDGHWYDALISRVVGQSFDEIQRRNIAKLRHRFPEKFDEFFANHRDLFGERTILEGNDKWLAENAAHIDEVFEGSQPQESNAEHEAYVDSLTLPERGAGA